MNKMTEKQLKMFITEVSFTLDDLGLYLDTHPTCDKALACYEHFKSLRTQAVKDYNILYGPLCKYQVNDENYFDWVNKPWPWEKEGDC